MIALVHCHLRRGGVTRVMFSQARLLRDAGHEVVLLSGESPAEPPPEGVEVRVIPGLGYRTDHSPAAVEALARALRAQAGGEVLWHFHNHSLGKNPVLTSVVDLFASEGGRMVLQIHDFAEDGRPGNLRLLRETLPEFPDGLYPVSPGIRYAVLQARDARALRAAGVPAEAVRVLPNPVTGIGIPPAPRDPPRRALYLSRAIRRKNLGEFLLWASLYGDELEFATSLVPENPGELPRFERWRDYAESRALPVTFGLGGNRPFADTTAWSDLCVTTSVGEGFGMSFLEPFLLGRPLAGRDLPDITTGFKEDGLRIDNLYPELPVPLDSLDEGFWPRARETVRNARAALGIHTPVSTRDLKTAWSPDGETIDFGRLDEPAQETVIDQAPGWGLALQLDIPPETIRQNREHILGMYGAAASTKRLVELYEGLRNAPASPLEHAKGDAIRDTFSSLEQMRLLRS